MINDEHRRKGEAWASAASTHMPIIVRLCIQPFLDLVSLHLVMSGAQWEKLQQAKVFTQVDGVAYRCMTLYDNVCVSIRLYILYH